MLKNGTRKSLHEMGGQYAVKERTGGKLFEIHVIFISWEPELLTAVVASG